MRDMTKPMTSSSCCTLSRLAKRIRASKQHVLLCFIQKENETKPETDRKKSEMKGSRESIVDSVGLVSGPLFTERLLYSK